MFRYIQNNRALGEANARVNSGKSDRNGTDSLEFLRYLWSDGLVTKGIYPFSAQLCPLVKTKGPRTSRPWDDVREEDRGRLELTINQR